VDIFGLWFKSKGLGVGVRGLLRRWLRARKRGKAGLILTTLHGVRHILCKPQAQF